MDNATLPDVGTGPWGVRHDEASGFYYLTNNGADDGRSYPLGKTAYRTARKHNDLAMAGGWLDDEPKAQPAPEPTKAEAGEPGHSTVTFSGTREEWLNTFTALARPEFAKRGFELPPVVHASVGFMFRSPKALGQCWRPEASEDGVSQIFINPTVAGSNTWLWAGILTHELCHAGTPGDKHGPKFKAWAHGVGLEGKPTQACDGPAFREWAEPILQALGPIPHSAIDPASSGVKKQSTRLPKCTCGDCGFIFRATAKHLNGKALRCPDDDCGGTVTVDGAG